MIAEFIDPAYLGFILVGVMLFAIFVGSYFIHINFLRFCIWLSRFWKISLLFNDPPVFDGYDRTNTRRRSALCLYGHNDGAGRIDGKIIFIISNDVG